VNWEIKADRFLQAFFSPASMFHSGTPDPTRCVGGRDSLFGRWVSAKPGREGPVSVMDFGENPWDDFNYRPIVDIVANKKSVYKWF
jgi:hypothetical protein